MNQELIRKYGLWVVAGALALYLVYRQTRGGASRPLIGPAPPGAAGFGAEQYRLESERLRQAGALDLQRLAINAKLEEERLRQNQRQFDVNAQMEAARRAREAIERGQTLGLIGQIANAISGLFRGQQAQQRPGPSTPSTFPGGATNPGRPQLPPSYPIPEPSVGAILFDPSYQPSYPEPTFYPAPVTDWGEAPAFEAAGMGLDTGATFYDQFANPYDQPSDIYSGLPEASPDFGYIADEWYNYYESQTPYYGGGGGGDYTPGVDEYEFYGFDFV